MTGIESRGVADDELRERYYLRLAADFDNLKGRARQEVVEANRYAPAGLARRIEAIGRPFDPSFHETVGFEDTTGVPDGTVIELQPG